MKSLSIILVTHNRWPSLRITLEHLRQLPQQPLIIVIDNHSTDATPDDLPALFPEVHYRRLETNAGIGSRNLGMRLCSTPYAAFCDDDSWWDGSALERAIRYLDTYPRLGLIAGRVLVGDAKRLDPACNCMRHSRLTAERPLPGKPVLGFVCCGAVVRKSAFLECGGFEPNFMIGGEETLLALDLRQRNWDVVYADDVIAFHHPSPSSRGHRQPMAVRNDIWTVWLKRRWPFVAVFTCQLLPRLTEPAVRKGFGLALRGLPWLVQKRAPVDSGLEKELRLLGIHQNI